MTENFSEVKYCGTLQMQVSDANDQQGVIYLKECNFANNDHNN